MNDSRESGVVGGDTDLTRMEDQTKPQRVFEDGLIPSSQTSSKIPVTPEELEYQRQLQQQFQQHNHNPAIPSPSSGHYAAGSPEHPYSDKTYYQTPSPEYPSTHRRPDFLKRKSTWIILALVIVVAVLAGLIGAMASGSIKTGSNSSAVAAGAAGTGTAGSPSPSTTPSASSTISKEATPTKDPKNEEENDPEPSTTSTTTSKKPKPTGTNIPENPKINSTTVNTRVGTVTLECPAADGIDYNLINNKGEQMTFSRYCGVNFPHGDMGLVTDKVILSLPECIEECANTEYCVGVIFNKIPNCWLKELISGKVDSDPLFGTEAAILKQ